MSTTAPAIRTAGQHASAKSTLDHAREYVAAGLSIIRVKCDGSKAPYGEWAEYQKRLPTDEELVAWYGCRRPYGIGIVGGAVSSNLERIDIDLPELVRPYLEEVQAQAPQLYERLTLIRSPKRDVEGRAGCHIAYRCEVPVETAKLAMGPPYKVADDNGKEREKRDTRIETKSEGGQCVAPGSPPQ